MRTLPVLLLALLITACSSNEKQQPLTAQWETDEMRIPESVLYYTEGSEPYLLVSEIDGKGDAADGQGGIAKLSLDGAVLDHDWVRGLNAPKGMGAHGGKLYVADLHHVVVIDIARGEIENQIEVHDSVFLNDIAINSDGVVYVSDTRTNKVHHIRDGSPETFLENVEAANGLTFVGSDLYIGANDTLWKADATGQLTKVAEGFEERADGVEKVSDNEFIVSCWAGLIYRVNTTSGEITKLLDTRGEGNTADIGWNPNDGVLYVPTFLKNSVVAYKLEL